MCFIECLEYWCTTNELGKLWAVEINLIEENYLYLGNLRGVDAGHKFLYIFSKASETDMVKSGEDRVFWWRKTSAFLLSIEKTPSV